MFVDTSGGILKRVEVSKKKSRWDMNGNSFFENVMGIGGELLHLP